MQFGFCSNDFARYPFTDCNERFSVFEPFESAGQRMEGINSPNADTFPSDFEKTKSLD